MALHAPQIGTRIEVTGPDKAERLCAIEGLFTGGKVEPRLLVLDRGFCANRNTSQAIHHRNEASEVDLCVVVDMDTGCLLNCLHRETRATDTVGSVNLLFGGLAGDPGRASVSRNTDIGISRDTHDSDRAVIGDVNKHH